MRVHFRVLSAALLVAALVMGCGPDKAGTDPSQSGGGGQSEEPSNGDPTPTEPPPPVEDPFADPPGPSHPGNRALDSDCDGLTDAEEWGNVYPGGLRTEPGR